MKKVILSFLIGLGIFVLLILVLFVGYGIKADSVIKNMTPIETKEIADNIFSLQESS